MSTIRGILLDVDGTLVDSNDAHAQAWTKALAEHGHTVAFEVVRPCIGMGGDKLLPKVARIDAESSLGKKISERRGEIFLKEFLPKLRPCRGANELLQEFKHRGLRIVAASSAKKDELGPLLKKCGADRLVEGATSSDDAENSKPDPDILQAAMKKLGMKPDEVVMLGDTPYDIESSQKAKVRVIALRCGGWKDADLSGADEIYDDPEDLMRNLDRSLFQV